MSFVITNSAAQPALKGQGVLITATEGSAVYVSSVNVGNEISLDTNGKIGTVTWVDTLSGQFKIQPQYPYSDLANSNGYLTGNEDIIIN